MLKALNPSKLCRSTGKQIIVKTFPGATTADMKYYVKPTLKRNPELVVLHVGTNDVQRKEPQEIADEVKTHTGWTDGNCHIRDYSEAR